LLPGLICPSILEFESDERSIWSINMMLLLLLLLLLLLSSLRSLAFSPAT